MAVDEGCKAKQTTGGKCCNAQRSKVKMPVYKRKRKTRGTSKGLPVKGGWRPARTSGAMTAAGI